MSATFNENIELATLSSLLKNASLYPIVEDILEKQSFGWIPYGIVYWGISQVVESDLYPDVQTVATYLDRAGLLDAVIIPSKNIRGIEALKYIEAIDVDESNLESYAYQVQELRATRQLRDLTGEIERNIEAGKRPIEILSDIDLETGKIAAYVGAKSQNVRDAKTVTQSSVDRFSEAVNGANRYIPTGIDAWDDFTNGLYGGRLYIVAAASNDGKSALVQNIIYNIAVRGVDSDREKRIKTMLITLETSAEEVTNRLIQIMTGLSPLNIEKGNLVSDNDIELYKAAIKEISSSPIMFDDSSELMLALLRTKIRKAVSTGVKVVIIDQLEQLIIGGSGDSQQEYLRLNYIAYRVKAFAREMDVPIILVHQMNRAADTGANRGKNGEPQLQDLAQAGEKAADAVMMIRHKKSEGDILESYFYWVKNRQGMKGRRRVEFEGRRILFKDPDETKLPDFVQGNLPNDNDELFS